MDFRRNYKYRIYPTPEQEQLLRQWEGTLRFLWNICHEQRLMALSDVPWRRQYLSNADQQKQMTELQRSECPWVQGLQCQARQKVLEDLNDAWQRCFKRLARQPRFKRHGSPMRIYAPVGTVAYTLTGDRLTGQLELGGPRYKPLGPLRIRLDRPVVGTVKSWSLKRDQDEWYAVAALVITKDDPQPVNNKVVGVDRGVVLLAADSDGNVFPNPRPRKTLEHKIRRTQRAVEKKKKGSANQKKARKRLAKLHRKIARQREVFAHTVSLHYAKNYGTVIMEDLKLKNMTGSAKGSVEEPGTNVRQKAGLNRAILDAGMGRLGELTQYKVEERGGVYFTMDPAYTSQECPQCHHIDPENRPTQADFRCTECGYERNADVAAALNIKERGLNSGPKAKKEVKKMPRLRRKPKSDTAVKPTVKQPVEVTSLEVR